MLVKVELKKVLDFMQEGEDCKIEISADGDAYVLPIRAAGYHDTIAIQELFADDYEGDEGQELPDNTDDYYMDWLNSCYRNLEIEAKNGELVKIEFVK